MAYDEALAERISSLLSGRRDIEEKKMFGGLAFLLSGNMCCGVAKERLMLRLGPEGAQAALDEEHAEPMDFTGRPMKSMIYVAAAGYESDEDLASWVDRAVAFAETLPPK